MERLLARVPERFSGVYPNFFEGTAVKGEGR
jgi:hypothetical protein